MLNIHNLLRHWWNIIWFFFMYNFYNIYMNVSTLREDIYITWLETDKIQKQTSDQKTWQNLFPSSAQLRTPFLWVSGPHSPKIVLRVILNTYTNTKSDLLQCFKPSQVTLQVCKHKPWCTLTVCVTFTKQFKHLHRLFWVCFLYGF